MTKKSETQVVAVAAIPNGGTAIETRRGGDIDNLIERAIDKSVPVETMEKLLAMRRELRAEFAKSEFERALANFQMECPVIEKKKKVDFETKDGKARVKYAYAPLDEIVGQVKSIIAKNGLSYTIETPPEAGKITSVVKVRHFAGHSETTQFSVPIDMNTKMSAQQQYGAASTFGKRYAFCNAFGILTGDEDTDATPDTTGEPSEKKPQPKTAATATTTTSAAKKPEPKTAEKTAGERDAKTLLSVGGALKAKPDDIINIRAFAVVIQDREIQGAPVTDYVLVDDKEPKSPTFMISVWGKRHPKIAEDAEVEAIGVKVALWQGALRGSTKTIMPAPEIAY